MNIRKYSFKKYTTYVIGIVIYMFLLIVISNGSNFIGILLRNYPAGGKYYISLNENEENQIRVNAYYRKVLYSGLEQDLSNLEVNISNYLIEVEPDDIYKKELIRIRLIENGYARIINEDIALDDELKAQEEAKKNETGIWYKGDYKHEGTLINIIRHIYDFMETNWWNAIKWVIFTGLGVGTIIKFVQKALLKRRVDLILMGGSNSGKTTILRRLKNPTISSVELMKKVQITHKEKIENIERIDFGGKHIYPSIIDNAGTNPGGMIDAVNMVHEHSMILYVIGISVTDGEIDKRNIEEEMKIAAYMLSAIRNAKTVRNYDRAVLFVNKMDLCYSDDEMANKETEVLKMMSHCNSYEKLKHEVNDIIIGSALKGWGMNSIVENIKKTC